MSRIAGALLEYAFTRADCLAGVFLDTTESNAVPAIAPHDGGSVECLLSSGVQAAAGALSSAQAVLMSSSSLNSLVSASTTAVTFEVWLRQNVTSRVSKTTTVLAIAPSVADASSQLCGYSVQLVQFAASDSRSPLGLTVIACGSNGFPLPVVNGALRNASSDLIYHLVVTLDYDPTLDTLSVAMYLNGALLSQKKSSNAAPYSPGVWSPSHYLQLLSSSTDQQAWPGQLYFLAYYASALSATQVAANYAAGIPDSAAVALSTTATVKENGEDETSHYADPLFYTREVPAAAVRSLQLSVFDLEDQSYCANACKRASATSSARIQIQTFPSSGSLLSFAGTPLTASNNIISRNDTSGTYLIRYRPNWNQISKPSLSVFDTFAIVALDGATGVASPTAGTVNIVVTPVVKPPSPLPVNFASIVANQYQILTLGGTVDARSSGVVSNASITLYPVAGTLYQVYPNSSISAQRAHISDKLWPGFRVAYIYEGNGAPNAETFPVVAVDFFQYTVTDSFGLFSVPATFTINVTTPIVATGPLAVSASAATSVSLMGADLSRMRRDISARIVSTTQQGRLVSSVTGQSLSNGSVVDTPLTYAEYSQGKGLNVTYASNAFFFNTPSKTWKGESLIVLPESFSFVYEAADGSRSLLLTTPVSVQNVNDKSDLTAAIKDFSVLAYSGVKASAPADERTSLLISGFNITDPDRGVDPIRAVIATSYKTGKVSMDKDALSRLDFSSFKYCFSLVRWQCEGDGTSGSKMSFIGQPSDISRALNTMTYINTQPNIVDQVIITIYDGATGDCLDNAQQGPGSIRGVSCYSSSVTVTVKVLGFSNVITNTEKSNSLLSIGYVLYAAIGLAVLLFALVARCVYFRYKASKAAAGRVFEQLDQVASPQDTDERKMNVKAGTYAMTAESTPDRPEPKQVTALGLPRPFPKVHLPSKNEREKPSELRAFAPQVDLIRGRQHQTKLAPFEMTRKSKSPPPVVSKAVEDNDTFKKNLAMFESRLVERPARKEKGGKMLRFQNHNDIQVSSSTRRVIPRTAEPTLDMLLYGTTGTTPEQEVKEQDVDFRSATLLTPKSRKVTKSKFKM